MNIGIVGAGQDKFSPELEQRAKSLIEQILADEDTVLVSGHSPVGGVDIWAEEIQDRLHPGQKIIHAPEVDQWDPPGQYGFKARNIDIAKDSKVLHVIVVASYPPGYAGRRFGVCYHCIRIPGRETLAYGHVKSGGCWTGAEALADKKVVWHVLE